ncbi:hypothetical protein PR048_011304 [Dryococelus australis]|uniref:Uncharacterized protein n=1 Tax=Dryococelus australis TaxID=614101 RepID=A0ABQ9HL80_9NEOP|nr:hypothetical protein PR048_011304 [Dryococelus australis]
MQVRGKRDIPEKSRRPAASSSTIPTCENPGATPLEIEPGPHCLEARSLTTKPLQPNDINRCPLLVLHVRIISIAGRCRWLAGFLGDLPFAPPLHSGTTHTHIDSPSSALKTSMLRAAQNSPLVSTITCSNRKLNHFLRNFQRHCKLNEGFLLLYDRETTAPGDASAHQVKLANISAPKSIMESNVHRRYARSDPVSNYYDFIINEGSYKFWAVFQVGTAALLIYSAFAAVYYAKYTFATTDYSDYEDDFFFRRSGAAYTPDTPSPDPGSIARSHQQWCQRRRSRSAALLDVHFPLAATHLSCDHSQQPTTSLSNFEG